VILEKQLKEKFSNNWDSVRKAFLDLDSDYDGFITVEDILRNFGQGGGRGQEMKNSGGINFNDLKKLIMEKDSTK
jgi:Ca2+-binding EF-hand superfamily protein